MGQLFLIIFTIMATETENIDADKNEEQNTCMSVDTDDSKQASETSDNSKSKTKSESAKKSRKRKLKLSTDEKQKEKATQPPKKKKKSRGWSDDEEKLFLEGLDKYGREWKKIATHVGTNRNAASIRSHAQVHFMKLLKNKQTLPDKVLESGNGYTLSGDALNKYSGTAIRYFGSADNVPLCDGVISDQEAAEKLKRPKKAKDDSTKSTKKDKTKKPKAKKKKKKKRSKYYDDSSDDEEFFANLPVGTPTATARRSSRNRNKVNTHQCMASHVTNPYGLRTDIVTYDAIVSPKEKILKSDLRILQPYQVKYCPNALLIADIHAHLLRSVEIMGLLGGVWDSENKIVHMTKCYPLKEEEQTDETVIASSCDTLLVRDQIKADGLDLVGWYHSHPNFENVPSNLDCYQHETNKPPQEMPYIGLIIESLWNTKIEGSHYRFFNTQPLNGAKDLEYMALQFMTDKEIKCCLEDEDLLQQISALVDRYTMCRYDPYRTDFGEIGDALFENINGHLGIGELENNEQNAKEDERVSIFMTKIRNMFTQKMNVWWQTNKPNTDNKENANSLN